MNSVLEGVNNGSHDKVDKLMPFYITKTFKTSELLQSFWVLQFVRDYTFFRVVKEDSWCPINLEKLETFYLFMAAKSL